MNFDIDQLTDDEIYVGEPLLELAEGDLEGLILVTKTGARVAEMMGLPSPATLVDIAELGARLHPDADLEDILSRYLRLFASGHLRYEAESHSLVVTFENGMVRRQQLGRPASDFVRVAIDAFEAPAP